MTRSGVPLQGATGEGKTWISAASPHGPDAAAWAGESIIANINAAAAIASWLARNGRPPFAAALVERI